MKKELIGAAIGAALAIWAAENCSAANLIQIQPYPDTLVYSNNQPYIREWQNNTGSTIYVTRIQTYIGGTSGFDGQLVIWTKRMSDNSQLQYLGWVDCNLMGTPDSTAYKDDFSPDSFAIAPGDGLVMEAIASNFQTLYQTVLVSIYIWYRNTP